MTSQWSIPLDFLYSRNIFDSLFVKNGGLPSFIIASTNREIALILACGEIPSISFNRWARRTKASCGTASGHRKEKKQRTIPWNAEMYRYFICRGLSEGTSRSEILKMNTRRAIRNATILASADGRAMRYASSVSALSISSIVGTRSAISTPKSCPAHHAQPPFARQGEVETCPRTPTQKRPERFHSGLSKITTLQLSSAIQEAPQLAAPARVLQLAQCLGLDLANTLAGHRELLADFFQRMVCVHADAEAHA